MFLLTLIRGNLISDTMQATRRIVRMKRNIQNAVNANEKKIFFSFIVLSVCNQRMDRNDHLNKKLITRIWITSKISINWFSLKLIS